MDKRTEIRNFSMCIMWIPVWFLSLLTFIGVVGFDVPNVMPGQLVNSLLNLSDATLITHLLCGEVGVGTGAVPVTLSEWTEKGQWDKEIIGIKHNCSQPAWAWDPWRRRDQSLQRHGGGETCPSTGHRPSQYPHKGQPGTPTGNIGKRIKLARAVN